MSDIQAWRNSLKILGVAIENTADLSKHILSAKIFAFTVDARYLGEEVILLDILSGLHPQTLRFLPTAVLISSEDFAS